MTVGVTFDLDGTLTTLDRPWQDIVETALLGEPDADAIETFAQTLRAGLEDLRSDSIEHAAAVTVRDHQLASDPATVAQRFRDREVSATVAVPGARQLVNRVAETHPTAILTNGDDDLQRRKADALGFTDAVDEIVVSTEAGASKPDGAIFETAARRLGAETFVHIGDDRSADVGGALAAGWEAVHVDGTGDPEEPLATVSDLSRLAALL